MGKDAKGPSSPTLTTAEGFICGAVAACCAVTVSNPQVVFVQSLLTASFSLAIRAEVAKTRLQLQGELKKKGVNKVYNSALDAIAKIWKNEGLRGIQRGLTPAVSYI